MRVPQIRFRIALLMAEQKLALLLGNKCLQQSALENLVLLNTKMRVQREKDLNELLFKI